jgi:hypothetical protein
VSEQPQLTKEQIMDLLKNIVVSVDINNNAVIISAYKLASYFMKNTEDIEEILKVDVTEDKKLIVYAKARPKNPFIESLIVKGVLKNDILSLLRAKYELIKDENDVYIKVYLQNNNSQNMSTVSPTKEIDF